jgi:hypothetical protein
MKFKFKILSSLLIIAFIFGNCANQKVVTKNNFKGKLSKEQLSEIAKLIKETEDEPLTEKSDKLRLSLSLWLIESPDITVRIYNTMKINDDYKYKRLFTIQGMLTPARIIIKNPELNDNHLQIQVKTLETLLNIYNKIVSLRGESAKSKGIESLVKKRENGELIEYVKSIIEKTDK